MENLPTELKNLIEEKAYKMNYEECMKEMKEQNKMICERLKNNSNNRSVVEYIEDDDGLYL